ncbi:MAG: class I SAM-dependent methyltransferase [Defluviimonas sp.]|uniref:class I SAM-dependent methyltransferase n=1 Tax=Albidovulum sp. TaxID=1872424 RepID=UPI001E0B533C|nr:class I SAM-dependent methyltransferase [Paracoccaceae bacterium]MCC0064327.1 class I SAM-dependent methyltransferase [Defluviimonas sp.]
MTFRTVETETRRSIRQARVFHGLRARLLYAVIGWLTRHATHLTFMNYGYAGALPAPLRPEDEAQRIPAQLYHAVAGQADLRGRRVLDVGTGRGGGARHVQVYFGPQSTTGCDLTAGILDFCRRVHRHVPGLDFVASDAMALPFAAASFDAVLSVESAHCYPERERFFAEAARVLTPGGVFLFADFTPADTREAPGAWLARTKAELARAGFERICFEDITAGVVRGLAADSDRRCAEIERRFPRGTRRLARLWAGTTESWIYDDFRGGRRRYYRGRMERAGALPERHARPARVDYGLTAELEPTT